MSKSRKGLWAKSWNTEESIGFAFLILGIFTLAAYFALVSKDPETWSYLFGICLGLFSVGLAFIAIGMSRKLDKRHTELLERLDKNIALLPTLFKNDILTMPGQILAKEMLSKQSKEAAQKRLDEDTKRVGYVRGEIYQLEDGSWGIAWGGKYPL